MWKNRLLTLIAVGAATVLLHPITGGQYWYVALVALAVGVLLYARASLPTVPAPQPEAMPFQFSRSHLAFMFVALIGFYFPLLRSITDIAFINTHIEYMVLAGCVGLMIVLTWRGNPLQISQDALILLVILLMALAIYIIRLGTHIPYMVDEWLFAVPVTRINERPPLLSQVTFFVPTPWIFTHWQWTVSTIAGNSLFSLRLVGALIGVFSVATAAFLGRELYGNRQQGYMAAFVLATFPPFIYFSRLALYNITDALFGFMAVALLLRAIRLHRTELFILAGVYIGLTHYFYEVGKVLFTPLIAALVLLMVVFNYRSIRTQWRGLTLTAIITAIVALPPWIANSIGQVQQLSRMDNVSIVFDPNIALNEKLWIMLGNFEESLTIITSNGETSIAYYGGEQGLVPSWMLPAFLLGVVVFAATPRKPVSLLFFLWTAAIILGNTPLDYIISARYVIYLPVAVFAIVAGYSYIAQLLPARWQAFIIAGVIATGIFNVYWYFLVHIPETNDTHNDNVATINLVDAYPLSLEIASYPPDTQVYVIHHRAGDHVLMTTDYIASHIDVVNLFAISSDRTDFPNIITEVTSDAVRILFIDPNELRVLQTLEQQVTLIPTTPAVPVPNLDMYFITE